jgi:hypothetical protein
MLKNLLLNFSLINLNFIVNINSLFQQKEKEMSEFAQIITRFEKEPVEATKYPKTMEGFQTYLDDMGIIYVSAREMCTPNHVSKAAEMGYDAFIPEHGWWERGGALASLFDSCRSLLGKPITVRNWWRPADYNAEVGGAPGSDHIAAYAFDMDFKSEDDRRTVEKYLKTMYRDEDLGMSLGLGGYTIHLGLLSERGNRTWYYDSYSA